MYCRNNMLQAYKTEGGFTMTEQLLRNAIKEAVEKEQVGLVIWAGQKAFDNNSSCKKSLFSEKQNDIVETGDGNCFYTITFCMSVPVDRLSEEEFFNNVLDFCKKKHYVGPIMLVPSNELVKSC